MAISQSIAVLSRSLSIAGACASGSVVYDRSVGRLVLSCSTVGAFAARPEAARQEWVLAARAVTP